MLNPGKENYLKKQQQQMTVNAGVQYVYKDNALFRHLTQIIKQKMYKR